MDENPFRPGWYPDPWEQAPWRWHDGTQWTGYTTQKPSPDRASQFWQVVPKTTHAWVAFLVAAFVGVAIWWPLVASLPRYNYSYDDVAYGDDAVSGWYFVLMIVAALVLGAVLSRSWNVVAPGLIAPQLVLAWFTAPRGDNDGLWIFIYVVLAFVFGVMHVAAAGSGLLVQRYLRK